MIKSVLRLEYAVAHFGEETCVKIGVTDEIGQYLVLH